MIQRNFSRRLATQQLVELAIDRMQRGLAPPAKIYRAGYRDQIDWSQFPSWARPADPEMYDCHEG